MKTLLTITQFMDRFQVSRSTVYRLIDNRRILTVKIGRAVRIPMDSVEKFERAIRAANDAG